MNEPADDAHALLLRRAWMLMHQDSGLLGFSDDRARQLIGNLTDLGAQDFLFAAVEHTIGVPGFFETPKAVFEAGSGTAGFLFSALGKGHDAYGIDNDRSRLAVAYAKIAAYGLPAQWADRAILGDAAAMPFDACTFDLVLGHQFIEHVDAVAGTLGELVRVTKRGGLIVLYAPDYRGPYEAHYQIPWPPFAPARLAEYWVEAFDRPTGFIPMFNYVTLPQVGAILQTLDCEIVTATIDRAIDPAAIRHFDISSPRAVTQSAKAIRTAFEAGSLPAHFCGPTNFAIAARKR
jgi:SAM-dependent methyltransferase